MPKLKNSLKIILLVISLLSDSLFLNAQKIAKPATPENWSQDYQPFRVVGNLYYVGTYDLACYLITTPKGNILINTGLAASQQTIKASIETLGFKFADITMLL